MEEIDTWIKFGTDGIRQVAGIWPLNAFGTQRIGLGLGTFLRSVSDSAHVLIGRDTRTSGDFISSSISSGLLACGVNVIDVGIITTAGIAYLTKQHQLDIGIVISASHNPWAENGIKLIGPSGFKLPDETERVIEDYINIEKHINIKGEYGHISRKEEWVEDYIQFLISPFKDLPFQNLCIALDCSNGAASDIAPRCFELLGSNVIVLNNNPSGININLDSGSEIVRESRGDLIPTVINDSAHFGVAFDGDADRAIFVDEMGNLIDGDHILYIFAKYLNSLGELNGKTIVTTEMANSGMDFALSELGIKVLRTKVGDKYVVQALTRNNYKLGGEQSGHIIVYDNEHTTGDGIYTALFLAEILLKEETISLSDLGSHLKKLPQVIASANLSKKPPIEDIEEFINEQDRILKVLGENSSLITRYSGTEPLFRVMIQGTDGQSLDEIIREAIKLCRVIQKKTGDEEGWLEVKDCTSGALIEISKF
ncbi:MAG: phosphoglucosamine mutase [Candidatus Kariarchaeaceae archaeon]